MLESIWSRPEWEVFAFFAFGIALGATVCARGVLRFGGDYPRRRPTLFGAEVGAIIGVAICVYLFASTNTAFEEIDGAALNVAEKARLAGFPTTKALTALTGTSRVLLNGAALVAQTAILGALWGRFALGRVLDWGERARRDGVATSGSETEERRDDA